MVIFDWIFVEGDTFIFFFLKFVLKLNLHSSFLGFSASSPEQVTLALWLAIFLRQLFQLYGYPPSTNNNVSPSLLRFEFIDAAHGWAAWHQENVQCLTLFKKWTVLDIVKFITLFTCGPHSLYKLFTAYPFLVSLMLSSLPLKGIPAYVFFNPLKTKRRLLYLKTQSVPRSKHFSSRL